MGGGIQLVQAVFGVKVVLISSSNIERCGRAKRISLCFEPSCSCTLCTLYFVLFAKLFYSGYCVNNILYDIMRKKSKGGPKQKKM